ncbi:MAG: hypothetical protein WD534_01660 [Phycisphaeraceae bacterium]
MPTLFDKDDVSTYTLGDSLKYIVEVLGSLAAGWGSHETAGVVYESAAKNILRHAKHIEGLAASVEDHGLQRRLLIAMAGVRRLMDSPAGDHTDDPITAMAIDAPAEAHPDRQPAFDEAFSQIGKALLTLSDEASTSPLPQSPQGDGTPFIRPMTPTEIANSVGVVVSTVTNWRREAGLHGLTGHSQKHAREEVEKILRVGASKPGGSGEACRKILAGKATN